MIVGAPSGQGPQGLNTYDLAPTALETYTFYFQSIFMF